MFVDHVHISAHKQRAHSRTSEQPQRLLVNNRVRPSVHPSVCSFVGSLQKRFSRVVELLLLRASFHRQAGRHPLSMESGPIKGPRRSGGKNRNGVRSFARVTLRGSRRVKCQPSESVRVNERTTCERTNERTRCEIDVVRDPVAGRSDPTSWKYEKDIISLSTYRYSYKEVVVYMMYRISSPYFYIAKHILHISPYQSFIESYSLCRQDHQLTCSMYM